MAKEQQMSLEGVSTLVLQRLCGVLDEHLHKVGQALASKISRHNEHLIFEGEATAQAQQAMATLLKIAQQRDLNEEDLHMAVIEARQLPDENDHFNEDGTAVDKSPRVGFKTRRGLLYGRTPRQNHYIHALMNHDIVFGLGPAGTGKTYLAVAAAVDAMEKHQIERIILVRPAVEAGEKLGFLPGDLTQKVDPYLRPLYDALFDLMGFERVGRLLEKGLIEIAPLAYMRGRTLNNAYVILDEAQNTTCEQMKMFLTRIGFGAHAVITGDTSQIDLPRHIKSGLKDAAEKLTAIDGIYFHHFTSSDVVRHPLVQKIVDAYDLADKAAADVPTT